jgi:hypothetical protein
MNGIHNLRSKLRPHHLYGVGLCMLCVMPLVLLGMSSGLVQLITIAIISIIMCASFCMTVVGMKTRGMIQLWGKITGMMPVQVLDFENRVNYCLVTSHAAGGYKGLLYFASAHCELHLCANGHVHDACEASFCYIWEPLDELTKTQLQLAYWDEWPDWHTWQQMSHLEKIEARNRVKKYT